MKRRTRQGPIDWEKVRARMAQVTASDVHLSADKARAVLEERARILARVPPAPLHTGDALEVATFTLANETYAIETRHVRAVVRVSDVTPLPGAPSFLVGVLNLRGDILALLDLRTFFGVGATAPTDLARVFVLGGDRAEFGLLADTALEVRTLRTDEILDPPPSVAGVGRAYLKGVTKEALIVLDGAALLKDGGLYIDQADD